MLEPELELEELLEDILTLTFDMDGCSCTVVLNDWDEKKKRREEERVELSFEIAAVCAGISQIKKKQTTTPA